MKNTTICLTTLCLSAKALQTKPRFRQQWVLKRKLSRQVRSVFHVTPRMVQIILSTQTPKTSKKSGTFIKANPNHLITQHQQRKHHHQTKWEPLTIHLQQKNQRGIQRLWCKFLKRRWHLDLISMHISRPLSQMALQLSGKTSLRHKRRLRMMIRMLNAPKYQHLLSLLPQRMMQVKLRLRLKKAKLKRPNKHPMARKTMEESLVRVKSAMSNSSATIAKWISWLLQNGKSSTTSLSSHLTSASESTLWASTKSSQKTHLTSILLWCSQKKSWERSRLRLSSGTPHLAWSTRSMSYRESNFGRIQNLRNSIGLLSHQQRVDTCFAKRKSLWSLWHWWKSIQVTLC